jgi:ubiquinone/menaquinone biosynthesis C-methylase UbiE
LKVVESERDRWQRPSDVIEALKLKQGNAVADVGSGAGYFALKLSRAVGSSGKVLAVDIRKLPLVFLWIRAFLRSQHNIRIRVGDPDDPRLPAGIVDAVLIANTYHEFANPELMLDHISRSLRLGGRLVVLDRSDSS